MENTNNTEGTKGLQPHEVRVVNERLELVDKITKLHAFMKSDFYQTLNEVSKKHFEEQEKAMIDYSEVLLKRINLFEGKMENTVIELTFGQKAVGVRFNPSGMNEVDKCKQSFAELIDQLNDFRNDKNPSLSSEAKRHASIAITELESAQMRAVKALTWVD